MTEKEKMLNGLPYDSRDRELIAMYHRARKLFSEYNRLNSENKQKRNEILNKLFKHKGAAVWVEAPFYCDYGENISIGANTFVNANCFFLDDNYITIGENGLIAPYVQIYTSSHPLDPRERIQSREGGTSYLTYTKPVVIGKNAWIGGNSVILPGVTIGDNVTVGAGSVVTKDIPDNVLAVGNPCRVIKNFESK